LLLLLLPTSPSKLLPLLPALAAPALLLAKEKALVDIMLTADGLLAPTALPLLPRAAVVAAG
jgi:hypothetical protein